MRTKNIMWQMVSRYIVAMIMVFVCCACEPPVPPIDPIDPDLGDVEFVVDFNQNNEGGDNGETPNKGDGTAESPVEVTEEEPLNVVVTQESSYTDPNGTVYTCEPKASVEVFAVEGRVYAENVEALTKISENVEVSTTESGENPVLYSTKQVFTIGGQKVVFDLSHEVYTYINSKDKEIEMPYIKVSEANFGYGATNEADDTRAKKSPISLRSLNITRASITEEVEYEVSARFNVELESVNTKSEQSKSIEIEIKYIGVVENVTELDGALSYEIDSSIEGNEIVESGELLLTINQVGTYSNDGESVYSAEPKANVTLSVDETKSFASNEELLSKVEQFGNTEFSSEGENPVLKVCTKTFDACGKKINFETSYQVYKIEGNDDVPYLEVGEPYLVDVDVVPRSETRADIVETRYYDVVAKFEVKLTGVNVRVPIEDTLEFVVKYQAEVENNVVGEISYTLDGNNGDNDFSFELNSGEEMTLTLNELSSYVFNGEVISSCEPKACIKLKTSGEMATIKNESEFEVVTSGDAIEGSEGDNPLIYTCQRNFNTLGQNFDFDLSYEVYEDEKYGQMPYLKLGKPEFVSVEVDKNSYNEEEKTTYYDVKARFKVDVESVNSDNALKETFEFVVCYQAKLTLELVEVRYRKNVEIEGPGLFDCTTMVNVVYRDREYSNGVIETDTFKSARHPIEAYLFNRDKNEEGDFDSLLGDTVKLADGFRVIFDAREDVRTEFSFDSRCTLRVSSFDLIDEVSPRGITPLVPSDEFDTVSYTKYYEDLFDLEDKSQYVLNHAVNTDGTLIHFDPENPVEGGWYSINVMASDEINLRYNGSFIFRRYSYTVLVYDSFLYIDGHPIYFRDNINYFLRFEEPTLTKEPLDGTDEYGPGYKYEFNLKGKFLDIDINAHMVDYIYTFKEEEN